MNGSPKIDYSLPSTSCRWLYLDANVRYGYRHIELAVAHWQLKSLDGEDALSTCGIIMHIALGILEMVPVIGHVIALMEKLIFDRKIEVLHLEGDTPFEIGKYHGERCKEFIQTTYKKILSFYTNKALDIYRSVDEALAIIEDLEAKIPDDYKEEMRGIAEGAGISYQEVLRMNLLLEMVPAYACSLFGTHIDETETILNKVAATNHTHNPTKVKIDSKTQISHHFISKESEQRLKTLEDFQGKGDIPSLKQALQAVNVNRTIQSIIMDPASRDFHIATGKSDAANRSYTHLSGEKLFKTSPDGQSCYRLARTLDWDLGPIIGPETKIFKMPAVDGKKSFVWIGWPGIIFPLTGMNEDGTAIAISSLPTPHSTNNDALKVMTPNGVFLRRILEEASTIQKASDIINGAKVGAGMHLVTAATDGLSRTELGRYHRAQPETIHTKKMLKVS